MNRPLFRAVLDHIKANPTALDQCLKAQCFSGIAAVLLNEHVPKEFAAWHRTRRAAAALEISQYDISWLDSVDRTIADFEAFLEKGGIPE